MKRVHGMAWAALTAVMVLAGFMYWVSLSDDSDYAYGPQAGAASAHESASAE
jgi:hypothetical protein